MKVRWHLISLLVIFIFGILGGALIYSSVEGWDFLDSLYFIVVTVTTIGYGDFAPHTPTGKILTMFFAFFGVAMALYLLSTISSSIFKKHVWAKVSELKRDVKKEGQIKEELKEVVRHSKRRKKKR